MADIISGAGTPFPKRIAFSKPIVNINHQNRGDERGSDDSRRHSANQGGPPGKYPERKVAVFKFANPDPELLPAIRPFPVRPENTALF